MNRGEVTAERIVLGAVASAAKIGLRRMTMNDIAREAGIARVTVYTHFPTKDDVLRAAALHELGLFLEELDTELQAHSTFEHRLVRTGVVAIRAMRRHPVVQHLLRTEPETLMPFLVGDSPLLEAAQGWATEVLFEDEHLLAIGREHAGEMLTRFVHSLLVRPSSTYDLGDEDDVECMLRTWLVTPVLGTAVLDDGVTEAACVCKTASV